MSVLCLNVCRLCVPNSMSFAICFKKFHLTSWHVYSVKMCVIFGVRVPFDKKLITKQTYMKTENANSILQSFKHLSQMSKSILIILSYTVSKLEHFLRHSADNKQYNKQEQTMLSLHYSNNKHHQAKHFNRTLAA